MTRFVFCNFKAKRTNVTCAQPLQFAAIVTDENFHILDTENWRYRITPHILPAPYALKVTSLTTEQVIDRLSSSRLLWQQRMPLPGKIEFLASKKVQSALQSLKT